MRAVGRGVVVLVAVWMLLGIHYFVFWVPLSIVMARTTGGDVEVAAGTFASVLAVAALACEVALLAHRRPALVRAIGRRPLRPSKGSTVRIVVDDLSGPEIAAFLDEHIQEMRSVTPPESKHALDLDGLRIPEVTFWSMFDGDTLVGCGAIKALDPTHAEVKSMRVAPSHRNRGIGSAMLEHIVSEARRRGFSRLSLETGSFEFFEPARRLYRKHGFEPCGPFSGYKEDANSAFMTKEL